MTTIFQIPAAAWKWWRNSLCRPRARSAVASLSWLLETHPQQPHRVTHRRRLEQSLQVLQRRRVIDREPRSCPALAPHLSRRGAGVEGDLLDRGRSCSGRHSSRARQPRSRSSPPPSPPPPRSTAGVARPAKAEARQTGRAGIMRLSSSRYRRSPRTRESARQPMPVKSQIPKSAIFGRRLRQVPATLQPVQSVARRALGSAQGPAANPLLLKCDRHHIAMHGGVLTTVHGLGACREPAVQWRKLSCLKPITG